MVGFSEVLSSIIDEFSLALFFETGSGMQQRLLGFAGVCLGSKEIAGPSYDIEMDYMQKGPPCE
jgi:hypothetical protein